jgi:hypothetical protein
MLDAMLLSRRHFCGLCAAVAAGAPVEAWAKPKEEPAIPTLPLDISIAEIDGKPVVGGAWLDEQLAEAARLFGPHGVSVGQARRRALGAPLARLENAEDRDALGGHIAARVINVFVVDFLRDVDDPEIERMGVRWRQRRDPRKDYVIVSARAWSTTLTHELGHFLGNGHSNVVDNVMSYRRLDPEKMSFDERQGARMRSVARRLLRSKKVVPLDELGADQAAQ